MIMDRPLQKFKVLLPYRQLYMTCTSSSSTSTNPIIPQGKLITASLDNTVRVWDLATGECLKTLFGHTEGVWSVSADSLRIISGSQDKRVIIWDAEAGTAMYSLLGHSGGVNCCQLSDTGVFSGDEIGVVKFWNFLPSNFPYKRDSPSSK